MAVDPTTDRVYVTDTASDPLVVLDGATDARLASLAVGRGSRGLAVDAASDRVYVSTRDGVAVLDGARDRVMATVAVGGSPGAVAANAGTNRVYVATSAHAAAVLEGATNRVRATALSDAGGVCPCEEQAPS